MSRISFSSVSSVQFGEEARGWGVAEETDVRLSLEITIDRHYLCARIYCHVFVHVDITNAHTHTRTHTVYMFVCFYVSTYVCMACVCMCVCAYLQNVADYALSLKRDVPS